MAAARDVPLTIKVHPVAYQRLFQAAKQRGQNSAAAYAQLLFNAAYAARIGQERGDPAADGELDEQLRLVFVLAGEANTAAIAKATGIPEPRVVRILDGWRQVAAEQPTAKPRAGAP